MDTSLKNNDGALEADNKNYQNYKDEPDKISDVLDDTKYNLMVECCHKNYSTFAPQWDVNERNYIDIPEGPSAKKSIVHRCTII
ncbi:pL83L [African swine fever virus]|uniref:BA71V-L83L n=1 Tax=African swine fever virus TaxID=10497 RepID=A0A0C5AWH8_ASF|nr:BA71V-L83L [African swine fever virus]UYB79152.1 pL83L [Recombinant African swine fever virus]AJL34174.1 BA71V-L83L [African swine fever virus]AXB49223.1 pL83L [African swine fever virus]AXB49396.1 pL83L [African swine fever virus]AXB49570.1 pL83L [African swine fever virus]